MTVAPAVEIAATTPEDALDVYAVTAAAFGRREEADLVDALFREEAVVLSLAAKLEGQVIAAVVFSRVRLESEAGTRAAVALAPVAVAPPFQRRGVGSLLVRDGLLRLAAMGERVVLVVGEPSYYGRFGFTAAAAAAIATPWSGPYLQALTLDDGPPPGPCQAVYSAAFG